MAWVADRVARVRWIFLPLGLCALVAVGAHAAAVGLTQRTWFARAVALLWELAADALIAVPLLGYDEREPAAEWKLAREMLQRTRSPLRLVRPAATLLVAIAGACSVARTVQGSLLLALHVWWIASLARAATLIGLLVLLAP